MKHYVHTKLKKHCHCDKGDNNRRQINDVKSTKKTEDTQRDLPHEKDPWHPKCKDRHKNTRRHNLEK